MSSRVAAVATVGPSSAVTRNAAPITLLIGAFLVGAFLPGTWAHFRMFKLVRILILLPLCGLFLSQRQSGLAFFVPPFGILDDFADVYPVFLDVDDLAEVHADVVADPDAMYCTLRVADDAP